MKTCRKCGNTKPLDAFPKLRSARDGRYTYCKECKAEWLRQHRRENPDYWREYNRRYKEKHRDRLRDQARARYAANRKTRARYQLSRRIKSDFGITLEEYDELVANPCGLCGATENIVLDHCHETNTVRGPLCQTCNKALGMLGDDPTRLRAAADYIEKHTRKEQHGEEKEVRVNR